MGTIHELEDQWAEEGEIADEGSRLLNLIGLLCSLGGMILFGLLALVNDAWTVLFVASALCMIMFASYVYAHMMCHINMLRHSLQESLNRELVHGTEVRLMRSQTDMGAADELFGTNPT